MLCASQSNARGIAVSYIARVSLILYLCTVTAFANAQMVIQADSAELQPQIGRDEIGFSSCGVRAVVVAKDNKFLDAYDFSLMVRSDVFGGTLKAGKVRTTAPALLKGKNSYELVVPAPINFWMAKESEGKALRPTRIIPAENKGYILGIADAADTFEIIMAMIHGDRLQFAIRYKKEPVDVVVAFSAAMPESERKPLMTCINGVIERLSKLAE